MTFSKIDVSAKVNFDYERLPDETDDHYEFRGLLKKWERCNLWAHIEVTPWMVGKIRRSELVCRMQQIMARNPGYVAEFRDALAGFQGIFPLLAIIPPSKS
jgi:hypothetical protein